ncbi:hypothetical protein VEx25_0966 [Vibrio antiquarius]|uniref:Uncharacterized protein n=1 Tax=Vibrio antiquarius (strain Ex25) TaxID=150340 RepID=A0ABM9WYQ9_VIBAE|nr:hypothetical protein VEx25_0966 [Vibrio antiquarius]
MLFQLFPSLLSIASAYLTPVDTQQQMSIRTKPKRV